MDIIYRDDKEGINWKKILRNGHLALFGLLYSLMLIASIYDPIYESIWLNIYTFVAWLPPIVLYWTPSFQKFVFDEVNKIWAFLIYPIAFIPLLGTTILIIPVAWRLKGSLSEKWENAQRINNLKRQINNFQVPSELKSEKKELERQAEETNTAEGLQKLERKFSKLKQKRMNQLSDHIEKFINQYGKGNPDQLGNLQELVNREENLDLDYETIRDLVFSEFEKKQKKQFEDKMDQKNADSYDETIEAFVEEFGEGDDKTLKFLRGYTGESEVRTDVQDKLHELQREKELKDFKQQLESGEDSIDLLESLKGKEIDWQEIEEMEGLDFEDLIADLFNEKGYDARVTVGSGDQGADIVAEKDFEKIVIQAKRYKGKVSNSAVQEVVASKEHYEANRGIVITNSAFTSSARELAESNDIELWGGQKLRKEVDKYLNKNYT